MAKNHKKAQVVGVLEFYGNAPFPRLGLKTEDGTLFYLDTKEADKDALGELHGNEVRVDGILSEEAAPLEMPSAGSTFKRPEGYYAGKLIMDAGLKGKMIGGAQVSEKHCGFIINKGGGSYGNEH